MAQTDTVAKVDETVEVQEAEDILPPLIESGMDPLVPCYASPPVETTSQHYSLKSKNVKVNRSARLLYVKGVNEILAGHDCIFCSEVIVRADIAAVTLGRNVYVGALSVIRPPLSYRSNKIKAYDVIIGDYVYIGSAVVTEAISIGNCVIIEDKCVLGSKSVIYDCVKILPNTVVPPETVLPPLTVWSGSPARCIGKLHEDAAFEIRDFVTAATAVHVKQMDSQ